MGHASPAIFPTRTALPLAVPVVAGWAARASAVTVAFVGLSGVLGALLSTDLRVDEAELTVAAQSLRGGYGDQPPLYAWILWAVSHVTGPGFLAVSLVRAALLLALVGVASAAARLLIADRRIATVAAFSPLLFPMFAWHAATYFTHSLLLAIAVLATVCATVRVVREGRTRDYLLLGFATALGGYAKYNFGLALLAAVAAGLTVPEARRRLLDRRMLLAASAAASLLLPHVAWFVEWHGEVLALVRSKGNRNHPPGYWEGVAMGLGAGALAVGASLAVALAVLWAVACRVPRSQAREPATVWLGRFLAVVVVLQLGLAFCGVTRFADRWLQPLLLPLPLWFLARFAPGALDRRLPLLAATLGGSATLVLVAQVGQVRFADRLPGGYDVRLDYAGLARDLEGAGYGDATLLGWDRELLGNLRVHLPRARLVQATGSDLFVRPPGRVVVLWDRRRWGPDSPPWDRTPRFMSERPPPPRPEDVRQFDLQPSSPCRRGVTVLVHELTR